MGSNIIELAKFGHERSAELKASCGAVDVRSLANLNHDELLGALGARVIDRLQMDGGMWVNFDWGSYRKNVSHLRIVK